jgi:hypothetical protein
LSNSISFTDVRIEHLYIGNGLSAEALSKIQTVRSFAPDKPQNAEEGYLVRPRLNDTGAICASAHLGQKCYAVKALVYRFGIFSEPASTSQPPDDAVLGMEGNNNFWYWGGTSTAAEIPGAVHASLNYPLNVLAIWKKTSQSSGALYSFDGYSTFTGKTGSTAPCGSSGSGSGRSGSDAVSAPVVIPGSGHVYPATIYGTWFSATGNCGCFTGSFPLAWDGTGWVGNFGNCSAPVTATLTPQSFAGGAALWFYTLQASGAIFAINSVPVASGSLPATGDIGVTGPCSGTVQLAFSE